MSPFAQPDKGGKWWLVGASWRNADVQAGQTDSYQQPGASDDMFIEGSKTDLLRLARENRMNTDVRRAIFVSIMGAEDYKEAHARLLKLRLTKMQELEIAPVLLHCVAAEPTYNRYYTLVAKKLCGDHKFRKAFQFRLWGVFRRMGEKDRLNEDDDDDDEFDDDEGQMDLKKVVNLATIYAELLSSGSLPITILKVRWFLFSIIQAILITVQILNFAYLQAKTIAFLEVLFTTLFQNLHQKVSKVNGDADKLIVDIFAKARDAPQMLAGLQFFLRTHVRKSSLAVTVEQQKSLKTSCRTATDILVLVTSAEL